MDNYSFNNREGVELSFVVPCYNESMNLDSFYLEILNQINTIIDLKNTRKEWKSTESWIDQMDTQLKFEAQMVDMIVKQDNRLSKIEEHLGIKEEKEDEQRDSNKEM